MGLFASHPDNPFEWAGLPSEPLQQHTDAELLEDPPVDPFAIATGTSGASISISAEVTPADPAPADDPQ
jgi:hypothetical protein